MAKEGGLFLALHFQTRFAVIGLSLLTSRVSADTLFDEHSFTAGIATHFTDERTTRSFVPFVGLRSALGVIVASEGLEMRFGPVIDLYDQSDNHDGLADTDQNRGYILGVALRIDKPVDRCWWLGGRASFGYGTSHADQNGLTGQVFSIGVHARNYAFTFGADVLLARTDESSTSLVASAGVTGRPGRIVTLGAVVAGALFGVAVVSLLPN